MKIVSISDKENSAIDRLAVMSNKRNDHLKISHFPLHPKRPDANQVHLLREAIKGADVIDCQYWKSAVTMLKLIPEAKDKKLILTHHNEHNINDTEKDRWEWRDYAWDRIVTKNGWQADQLRKQGFDPLIIRHSPEFKNFTFTQDLTEEKIVLYVGQVKKNKGVRELKQACDELGYRLMIVGSVSEAGYWEELNKENLIMMSNVPDDQIGEVFSQARVYCANSDDGTESGTMPILEAMVAGIPVVTRKIGLVRDVGKHQKNMWIRSGKYTDIEDLKEALQMVMENEDIANEMRENAWRSVRQYHPAIQAREYNKLYHRVVYGDEPIVSVIIPTFNRADILVHQLASLTEQDYKNFEVVICDDGSTDNTMAVVDEARKLYDFPIRYVNTGDTERYGLAKARNLGVIESVGDILVFCDDRLKMHPTALSSFVSKIKTVSNQQGHRKVWIWGSKGGYKSFVENFSATWRQSFINGGMFNERIEQYGGLTQETDRRFNAQGFKFDWCPESLAEPMIGTHSKSRNRENIIKSKIQLYKMGLQ